MPSYDNRQCLQAHLQTSHHEENKLLCVYEIMDVNETYWGNHSTIYKVIVLYILNLCSTYASDIVMKLQKTSLDIAEREPPF